MNKFSKIAALVLALIVFAVSLSLFASCYHQSVCHDGESEYVVTHFDINGSHCRLCQLSTLISAALRHFFETSLYALLLSVAIFISILCGVAIYSYRKECQTLAALKVRLNN